MKAHKPRYFQKVNIQNPLLKSVHMDILPDKLQVIDYSGNIPDSYFTVTGSGFSVEARPEGRALIFPRTASNQIDLSDNGQDAEFPGGRLEFSFLYYFTFEGNNTDGDEYTLGSNSTTLGPTTDVSGVFNVEDGLPHILLITRNADVARSYMDGVLLAEDTGPLAEETETYLFRYLPSTETFNLWLSNTSGETDTMIGGTPQKTTDRWEGPMHRVTHWDRCLTESEAKEINNNPWFGYEYDFISAGLPVAAVGGATIPIFNQHYQNQGIM